MKLTMIKVNPKQLFKSQKSRSVSRSDPSSFGSGSSSSSSESLSIQPRKSKPGKETPKSVLPSNSSVMSEISGDWSLLSNDMCYELVQAFNMIDKDGDGKITRKELEVVLSRVGPEPPSEEELMTMLGEVDRDGDGCISLEEFSAVNSAFGPPSSVSELRDAFDFFDTDHDGRITAEELLAVFAALGDDRCTLEDCLRMIRGVNKNGDGFVCFEDFARMMDQQR